jgi:6-phosphogluconate dehydrogenase (decarboxylating)
LGLTEGEKKDLEEYLKSLYYSVHIYFVKLIRNAIEFGMVQAIAEGIDLLTRPDYPLDLPALFHNWSHGSVIRGWLVELRSAACMDTARGPQ